MVLPPFVGKHVDVARGFPMGHPQDGVLSIFMYHFQVSQMSLSFEQCNYLCSLLMRCMNAVPLFQSHSSFSVLEHSSLSCVIEINCLQGMPKFRYLLCYLLLPFPYCVCSCLFELRVKAIFLQALFDDGLVAISLLKLCNSN